MRHIIIMIFILITSALTGQLEWGEGMQFAESHNVLTGDVAVGEEAVYYCWLEDVEEEFCILLQGYDESGETVWLNPVIQESNGDIAGKANIGMGDEGTILLFWQCYSTDGIITENHLQKLDDWGNKLWGDEGVQIGNIDTNCYQISGDGSGGLYLIYESNGHLTGWHYGDAGELVTGWEEGIYLGYIATDAVDTKLSFGQNGEGEIALFKRLTTGTQAGVYFQIFDYNGEPEYPGDGMFIGEADASGLSLEILSEDDYMFCWHNSNVIKGNKLLGNGELLYDEAVILSEYEEQYIYKTQHIGEIVYLILTNDEETVYIGKYDEEWQELNDPQDTQISYGFKFDIFIKSDGNIIFFDSYYHFDARILEYDENANLVSPESGWLEINALDYHLAVEGLTTYVYWREGFEGINQTILNNGELLYEDNQELYSGVYHFPQYNGSYRMEDKIVFWWCEDNYRHNGVSYLNEDGEVLLTEDIFIDSDQNNRIDYQLNLNNGIIFSVIDRNAEDRYDFSIFMINTEAEPYFPWGVPGITLHSFDSIEGYLPYIKIDNEHILFLWYENGEMMGQLLDENGIMWQEGGVALEFPQGCGAIPFPKYTESYLSCGDGEGIYLNCWDEDFNLMWEDSVWLYDCEWDFREPSYEYVSEAGLVMYWTSYSGGDCRLVKQVITPAGEKLCGDNGTVILNTGNLEIRDILVDESNELIAIVYGAEDEPLVRFMTKDGILLSDDRVSFPEINGREFTDIILKDGFLTFFTEDGLFFDHQLRVCVYDLEGNLVPDLPGPDYYVDSNFNSGVLVSDEAIYFTFVQEHREEYFLWIPMGPGYDLYAQKLGLPNAGIQSDEIIGEYSWLRVYPNPFNPEVHIIWEIDQIKDDCRLGIYNIRGQKMRDFVIDNAYDQLIWDGKDTSGHPCASGIYLMNLHNGEEQVNRKILLMR